MAIDPKPRNSVTSPPSSSSNGSKIWLFSLLLTLQYGSQPLISKWFIRREVIVTSSVLMCEILEVALALFFMSREGTLLKLLRRWTLADSLIASGLPAAIYALQNSLLQISYRNLDSLTFSMLNQTKIFFTALLMFIILRFVTKAVNSTNRSSFPVDNGSDSSYIGEGSSNGSSSDNLDQIFFYGIVPIMVASALSGMASSLCQWASQVKKHSSYLMTIEMSVVGCLCLLASTLKSPDREAIRKHGFFYGWTPLTLIPVISNAVGDILVGLITSYAGGVRKTSVTWMLGFVIVSALIVTALLRFIFEGKPPSQYYLVALPLVAGSISTYQKYPYRVEKKEA